MISSPVVWSSSDGRVAAALVSSASKRLRLNRRFGRRWNLSSGRQRFRRLNHSVRGDAKMAIKIGRGRRCAEAAHTYERAAFAEVAIPAETRARLNADA